MKKKIMHLALLLASCGIALASCQTTTSTSSNSSTSSSSSTSSESIKAKYDVSAEVSEGINLKFNGQDNLKVEEGTEVTVTLTYSEHYLFKSISSNDVTLQTVEEGLTYKFVMPNKNVVISAEACLPSHAINVTTSEGVSVTFGKDGLTSLEAKFGDEITLNLVYQENFEFKSITSDDVELTAITEGSKYTFTMPDKAININVVAKKINSNFNSLKILGKDLSNFKISYGTTEAFELNDNNLTTTDIRVGTEVAFSVNLGGYYKESYFVELYVNDVKCETTLKDSVYTGKFVMPAENVDLVLVKAFKEVENSNKAFKLTLKEPTDDSYKIYGAKNGGYYPNSDANNYADFYLYVVYKDGYTINSTYEGFTSTQVAVNSYSDNVITYKISSYSFRGTDATFDFTTKNVGVHNVTFFDAEKLNVVGKTTYTPGEWVSLKVTSNENYKIEGLDSAYVNDKKVSLSIIPNSYNVWDSSKGTLSFIMPEGGDVVLHMNLKEIKKLKFTLPEDGTVTDVKFGEYSSYSEYSKLTSGVPGTKVYVFPTLKEGYAISKIYYQEGKEVNYSGDKYSFVIPDEGDVNLTFETIKLKNVILDKTHTDQYVITSDKSSYKEGETVTITVNAKLGFVVTGLSLDDSSITDLTQNASNPTKWTFTIGSKDVKVTVLGNVVNVSQFSIEDKNNGVKGSNLYNSKNSIVSDKRFNEGDTGYISISMKNGFSVSKVSLKYGDTTQELSLITEGTFKNKYQFTVPSVDATIVIESIEASKSTLSIAGLEDLTVSVRDNTYYEDIENVDSIYNMYSEHKIKITLTNSENHYLDNEEQISLKNGDQNVDFTFTSSSNYVTIEFVAPKESENIVLSVTPRAYTKCKITISTESEKYIKVQTSSGGWSYKDFDTKNNTIKIDSSIRIKYIGGDSGYNTDSMKYLVIRSATDNKLLKCYKFGNYSYDYYEYIITCDITLSTSTSEVKQ